MPLFEYVCMSSHVTDRLVRNRDDIPAHTRCETCGGPAFRKEFGLVAHRITRKTNTSEKLTSYHEAAQEMQLRHDSTDDPAIKAANPPEVWAAAKYRAEAQMLAGATRWDRDKPEWKAKEVE